MTYTSGSDVLWIIYMINGKIFAWSALYNFESEREVPLIVSETDIIISYDSTEKNTMKQRKKHIKFLKKWLVLQH